jgi:hypothetical protein
MFFFSQFVFSFLISPFFPFDLSPTIGTVRMVSPMKHKGLILRTPEKLIILADIFALFSMETSMQALRPYILYLSFLREKGETLDRGLIENLEELFGVGPHNSENKTRFTIDEELPNVLDNADKKSFDVEYEVSSQVINMMAKNLEGLEQGLSAGKVLDGGGGVPVCLEEPSGREGQDGRDKLSDRDESGSREQERVVRIKTITDVGPGGPPAGALAKIVIVANRRLDQTRIMFCSVEGREQHSFSVNTADLRQGPFWRQ